LLHENGFSELAVQKDAYERDGAILIEGLLSEEQLKLIASGIDKIISRPSKRHVDYVNEGDGGQRFFTTQSCFQISKKLRLRFELRCLHYVDPGFFGLDD
jgi:hypothetical protein